ncbi:putative aminopeptidase W07G4.4-like [Tropilaelaps mercedesae]|uniref:Putative aminopeptidase W07G4.4-like n=1 Tax=Tropilaelaps mercedesae TaxID=418985 RepID=A0A1V9X507_9ACAR|nr:putative aminopeptidase W07G4.4-like [Tropilaelaps mercedesae]
MSGAKECIDFLKANVKLEESISVDDYDCIVIVGTSLCPKALAKANGFAAALEAVKETDAAFDKQVSLLSVNGTRVVYSPTGPLNRDHDDVRVFYDAAVKGVKRALSAGAKKPLVSLPAGPLHPHTGFSIEAATVLGSLEAIYVPLEIREDVPDRKRKVNKIGFLNFTGGASRLSYLLNVESGRIACRDIGGSDPERMAPPKVEEYVTQLFANTPVAVKVVANREQLEANYPCLAAVDRCASHLKRHNARMIFLEYRDGTAEEVIALVGKGVTYDTGGADIKAGGVMAGMHRDKCGSAAVAGFFQTLVAAKCKNIRVLGAMCMVRNSVGSDSYVADELITSRAGVRIRVGNTDAEGRMVMVDALAEMKERILEAGAPDKAHIYTIATLTGHACLAVGEPYSISIDNGPARANNSSQTLQAAGEQVGDMFEISTLRREDYSMVEGKSEYEDILQCNNAPSSRTRRGHQFPVAFLIRVAGLDKHGRDSAKPIAYSHLDIAASSGPFPGIPSGAPVPALAQKYIYPRI